MIKPLTKERRAQIVDIYAGTPLVDEMLAAEIFWREIVICLKTGFCWCPVGIGNPMYRDHTETCKRIQEAMGAA